MHDFSCTEPKEMYYKPLEERTRYFKENEEGVGSMCREMEKMRDKAAKEAEIATKRKMIENFLSLGALSVEDIAKASELSIAEVQAIASSMKGNSHV